MFKPTTEHVAVQVETSRTDVWVPEGLAVQRHPYTQDGYAVALDSTDMTLHEKKPQGPGGRGWPYGPWQVVTDGDWTSMVTENWNISATLNYPTDANPTGPCITSLRYPIPVAAGMQVALSGQFGVRRSGLRFSSPFDPDDLDEPIDILVTLWALGTRTDEYGNEFDVKRMFIQHRARLQNGGDTSLTMVSFTLGDPGAPTWKTVPADVDRVYLSIDMIDGEQASIINDLNPPEFISTNFRFPDSATVAQRTVFRCPKVDATAANPIRVHVRDPQNTNPTYPNQLSSTGYAFRNRARFDNITPGVELTALSTPDATGPVTLSIYEWTTSRGSLLDTLVVPQGEKVILTLDHTGPIDIAGTGGYDIESVLAPAVETDTVEQTRTTRYEYTPVTDPVSSIKTQVLEAGLPVATVRFISDTIAADVVAGKRVRVLARTSTPVTVFAGTVRTRRIVSTARRRQQLEIGVHGEWAKLQTDYPYMFDSFTKYGPALHGLGVQVEVDGVDYTGPSGDLPAWLTMQPAYIGTGTLLDGLLATRNSGLSYLFLDRRGRLILTSTLPDSIAVELSDQPEYDGPSYSRDLEFTTDSTSLVNVVDVEEHLLDYMKHSVRRNNTGGDSPHTRQSAPPDTIARTIRYQDDLSVDAYGQSPARVPIVRGDGNPYSAFTSPTFEDRASYILDRYSTERHEVTNLHVPVDKPGHLPTLAALQPLDAIVVRHQGTAYVARLRSITHNISPDRWSCELAASVRRDQVYWLPDPPEPDDPPIIGGFYNDPGVGTYDGGTPDSTGLGIIDGGEL